MPAGGQFRLPPSAAEERVSSSRSGPLAQLAEHRCPCRESARQSCKKEHGSWYFAHDLPTLPDDPHRSRIRRGGYPTRNAAEEALSASLIRYRQAGLAAEQNLQGRRQFLVDYLPQWLDGRKKLKPSTRRSYETHIARYLVPGLGHLRLEELSPSHIEDLYEDMRELRLRKHPKDGGEPNTWRLSPTTIQKVHGTLRKALNDAVRRYRYLDHNPAQYVELEAANTRPAKVLALRWDDVDLDEGTIDIQRTIVQLGYATVQGTPKSQASRRLVAIDDDTISALKEHRNRQREMLGASFDPHGLVFTKADGKALHPEYFSRHLDVLIKRAVVPRITFHQLRHTAASLMLEAGAELKYVHHGQDLRPHH